MTYELKTTFEKLLNHQQSKPSTCDVCRKNKAEKLIIGKTTNNNSDLLIGVCKKCLKVN